MKTYKKAVLLLAALLGLLGLLLMASFTTYDACEVANSNTLFIKEQTQLALAAPNFEKSKYHTFKALKSVYTTKQNFKDCGCESASEQLVLTEVNLKNVIKAPEFKDAKTFLDIALKNTAICLKVLKNFEENQNKGTYGDDLLVLNAIQREPPQEAVSLPENQELQDALKRSLSKFQNSMDDVLNKVDCPEALKFIEKVQVQSKERLLNPELSQAKKYYHYGVLQIADNASGQLKGCN